MLLTTSYPSAFQEFDGDLNMSTPQILAYPLSQSIDAIRGSNTTREIVKDTAIAHVSTLPTGKGISKMRMSHHTYKCTARIFGNSTLSILLFGSHLNQSWPNSALSLSTVKTVCNQGYSSSCLTKKPMFELSALSPERACTILPRAADFVGPSVSRLIGCCVS